MDRKKADFIIKRYQLEHLVPMAITLLAIYLSLNFLQKNIISILGLIISLLGLAIWWSAKITLAENWSAGYGKPQLKKFVSKGVYSKISHPLYLGVNLTLIGLSLIYKKSWFVLTSLVIVIYFFRRMQIEDKFLLKRLGKKYRKYKEKTWI